MADGTTSVNAQAVKFFEDMSVRSTLAAAFRLRLRDIVRDEERPGALEKWFAEVAGYRGVKAEHLQPAVEHFRAHRLSFWNGTYTLDAGTGGPRVVVIDGNTVWVDDQIITAYTYDADRLTWSDQPGDAPAGALSFAIGGAAYENDFEKDAFWKRVSGSLTVGGRTFEVTGTTLVVWFDEAAPADSNDFHASAMLGAEADTLASRSGDYVVTPYPSGTDTFQRLVVNADETVTYGGIEVTSPTYSTATKTLTWSDEQTRGRVTFAATKGSTKVFFGFIYPAGTRDTTTNCHGETESDKPTSYSTVDVFVITGTVLAALVFIPLTISSAARKDGTLRVFYEWLTERSPETQQRATISIDAQLNILSEAQKADPTVPTNEGELKKAIQSLDDRAKKLDDRVKNEAVKVSESEEALETKRETLNETQRQLDNLGPTVDAQTRTDLERKKKEQEKDVKKSEGEHDEKKKKHEENERKRKEAKEHAEQAKNLAGEGR